VRLLRPENRDPWDGNPGRAAPTGGFLRVQAYVEKGDSTCTANKKSIKANQHGIFPVDRGRLQREGEHMCFGPGRTSRLGHMKKRGTFKAQKKKETADWGKDRLNYHNGF